MIKGDPHDVVIVGAGIAGISAAVECKKSGLNKVLVIDKNNYVGGHELTIDRQNGLDISFLFGHHCYENLVETVQDHGLETIKSDLSLRSISEKGPLYDNTVSSPQWQPELERFCSLAESIQPQWWILNFQDWCDLYNFGKQFRRQVLEPILPLLFVTHNSAWRKPAPAILLMIANRDRTDSWVDVHSDRKHPRLCSVVGGNCQIVDGLIRKYNVEVELKQHLQNLKKEGSVWHLSTESGLHLRAHKVILACHPSEFEDAEHCYPGWTSSQRSVMAYAKKHASWVNGYFRPKEIRREERVAGKCLYEVEERALTLLLPQNVHYDFTLSLGGYNHENTIAAKSLRRFQWVHPEQDTDYMIRAVLDWIGPWQESNGIYFAGGWTSVLSHEHAFESGRRAVHRMMSPCETRAIMIINLLWQIPLYILIKVISFFVAMLMALVYRRAGLGLCGSL